MNKNKSGLAYLKKSMMAVPFFQAGEDRYCQAFLIFVFFISESFSLEAAQMEKTQAERKTLIN